MKSVLQAAALVAALMIPGLAAPAFADGSYEGHHGGTFTWDRDCYNGAVFDACRRTTTYTGPGGNTWERGRGWWNGPFTQGHGGHFTRPSGFNTWHLHGHGRAGGHFYARGWGWR